MMRTDFRLLLACMATTLLLTSPVPEALAAGTVAAPTRCTALPQTLKLAPHVSITAVEAVAAGAFKLPGAPGAGGMGPRLDFSALPAFCRVAATSRPTADSDIRFEVWMPLEGWNGKFVGGGNGVWAGSIAYGDMVTPLARGYATAASDVGHQGSPLDGSFLAGHPEKLIDFGHRAVHETAVAAKATVAAFYGKPPQRSLYASCSTGGRIGLMQAYRYPGDYDGISAMAPANPMVPLMVMSLWTGAATMKDEASRIPAPKFALVGKAAVAACDADDGVTDGIIRHPPSCRFDPAVLQCKGADTADCLTAPQVAALRAIYDGPRNPRTGQRIYPGLALGSEAQMLALTMGNEPFPVATTFFKGPVFNNPQWDFRSFDYDRDTQRALAYGSDALDVPPGGLKPFFAGGRKLLLSHGWADGLIPAQSTIDFHDALVKDIGPQRAQQGLRLFMAPGMAHCAGGVGPSSVDMLGEIDRWVETGRPPERIVARSMPDQPARSRPLCPHPTVAVYAGKGSTDEAESFRCEPPP
jgi:feruloyl esterase